MRVLFIYPNQSTYMPPHYHHGIGILSAMLKKEGHETGLLVYDSPVEQDKLISDVKSFSPHVIGFSATTNQYKHAREYASWIKDRMKVITVIGGVHATMAPDSVIEHTEWDFLIQGEAEEAIVELVSALEADKHPSTIPNIWLRRGDKIFNNEPRPLIENLDSLPFSDREIFDEEHLLRGSRGAMAILASRGCPFGCSYCCNPAYRRLYRGKGTWVRRRSIENIIEEIKLLASAYPIKLLYFDDDVFTLDKKWLLDFLEIYKKDIKLPFRVNVRVETIDRETLFALKEAGCDMIQIGVEHGDENFRKEILNRRMSNEQIENVFRWAQEADIRTWSFNMIGFPGETVQSARSTIEINRKLKPDHLQISVFNPYPGTELYELCLQKGYFSENARTTDGFFNPEFPLELPTISKEELKALHREMVELSEALEAQKKLERKYKGRKVLYDFTDMLPNAEITQPEEGYVKQTYFSIDDDLRKTLQAHPPSKVSYRLRIPVDAILEFALGVHPSVWDRAEGEGIIFSIELTPLKIFGKKEKIFLSSHHLDPRRRLTDRKWHEFSVDLSRFANKKVVLSFTTNMKNNSSSDFNTAGWAEPVIVSKQ